MLEKKQVFGPAGSIRAIKNAIEVYDKLHRFTPASLPSFQRAHKLLMTGLMESPGKIRTRLINYVRGDEIKYFPPDGKIVRQLLASLFEYLKNSRDIALIKSCVFRYELEFIHPFMEGNGRLGRLWQTVILMDQHPVFEFLPVDCIIKKRQNFYYNSFGQAGGWGDSTAFIEFMLGVILESLQELLSGPVPVLTALERIERFGADIGTRSFSRKDYLKMYKAISTATASRDLREGVIKKILKKDGDKRAASYCFIAK
ncbi:MAG TPA: Fic family protein [Puia sp.]|nr:Fic family protein [Puia sp.]